MSRVPKNIMILTIIAFYPCPTLKDYQQFFQLLTKTLQVNMRLGLHVPPHFVILKNNLKSKNCQKP